MLQESANQRNDSRRATPHLESNEPIVHPSDGGFPSPPPGHRQPPASQGPEFINVISPLVSSILLAMVISGADGGPTGGVPAPLDQQLRREDPSSLAARCPTPGRRPSRRPGLLSAGARRAPNATSTSEPTAPPTLGPDLASLGKDVPDVELVEGILEPSKVIKKGYEPITIATDDGRTINGLLAEERPDAVVLRDPAQDGKPVTIARGRIEQQGTAGTSLMPAGLSIRWAPGSSSSTWCATSWRSPSRGRRGLASLRPAPSLFAAALARVRTRSRSRRVDRRAGLRRASSAARRSMSVSAPTATARRTSPARCRPSLRFAEGKFKNGSDPFRMYQTLTHGFGMMTPQTWMVPQQKYDVIHYIREAYLKPAQPGQYARVDRGIPGRAAQGDDPRADAVQHRAVGDDGLRAEPDGDPRGRRRRPTSPTRGSPSGSTRGRAAFRAAGTGCSSTTTRCACRPRPGPARGSSTGTASTSTAGMRSIRGSSGEVHFANPVGPGWANPETGRFEDPRLRGRDGKPYGPLPRAWAHYKGLYHHGNQVDPRLHCRGRRHPRNAWPMRWIRRIRTWSSRARSNVGPSPHDLLMRVAPRGSPSASSARRRS